jgi:hypothetical protein
MTQSQHGESITYLGLLGNQALFQKIGFSRQEMATGLQRLCIRICQNQTGCTVITSLNVEKDDITIACHKTPECDKRIIKVTNNFLHMLSAHINVVEPANIDIIPGQLALF